MKAKIRISCSVLIGIDLIPTFECNSLTYGLDPGFSLLLLSGIPRLTVKASIVGLPHIDNWDPQWS